MDGLVTEAQAALLTLSSLIYPGNSKPGTMKVLLSFDRAQALGNLQARFPFERPEWGTPLDNLIYAVNRLANRSMFAVLISTKPQLEHIDPPASTVMPSYARSRIVPVVLHAPITETPFDCFGQQPLNPAFLYEHTISDVGLMACFGRPLYFVFIFYVIVLANFSLV